MTVSKKKSKFSKPIVSKPHLVEYAYENGHKKSVAYYIGLNLHGRYLEFHPNGAKKIECYYDNGKRIGDYQSWYDDGNKHCQWSYDVNNKKHGVEIHWTPYGEKIFKTTFIHGVEHGKRKFWNRKGIKTLEVEYDNGQPVKITNRYETGELMSVVKWKDGVMDSYKSYLKNGKRNKE